MAERHGVAEMMGEALRESAVLVAVFGMLDKYVHGEGPLLGLDSSCFGHHLVLVRNRRHNRASETVMGEYTGLVGLAIWGLIMGTVGLIAAERERRAYRRNLGRRDSAAPTG